MMDRKKIEICKEKCIYNLQLHVSALYNKLAKGRHTKNMLFLVVEKLRSGYSLTSLDSVVHNFLFN